MTVGKGPPLTRKGPLPTGKGPPPYGKGPSPTRKGPLPVGKGRSPTRKGPLPVGKGPSPTRKGPRLRSKGPRPRSKRSLPNDQGRRPKKNGPLSMNKGPFPKHKGDFVIRRATLSDQRSTFLEDISRTTSTERRPTHCHLRNGDRHGHHGQVHPSLPRHAQPAQARASAHCVRVGLVARFHEREGCR